MTDEMKTRPWSEVKAEARSKMTPEQLAEHDAEIERLKFAQEFGEAVQTRWDNAMERFFEEVENVRLRRGLSQDEVSAALEEVFGRVVAEAWDEWCE